MKAYYADYVNHILRFYVRHPDKISFRTNVDRANYAAAQTVFIGLSEKEKDILYDVYSRRDTIGDNVYDVAKERQMLQEDIWSLISNVTWKIAKERNLI